MPKWLVYIRVASHNYTLSFQYSSRYSSLIKNMHMCKGEKRIYNTTFYHRNQVVVFVHFRHVLSKYKGLAVC